MPNSNDQKIANRDVPTLRTLNAWYRQNALDLLRVGQIETVRPASHNEFDANDPGDLDCFEFVCEEEALLGRQELILDKAIEHGVHDATDARAILELWYQSVFRETAKGDLRPEHWLIYAVYEKRHLVF